MFSGPINTVSGCFLWFDASTIGNLPSGNPIYYWQDLSNSGNNTTVVNNISGQAPTYNPNTLNGYPTVKFSSSEGLTSNTNSSLNLTSNNLTLFTVFSNSQSGTQPITSIDIGTQESRIVYISALNISNGFDFQTSAEELTSSSSIPINKFVIRTDRFSQNGYGIIDYFNQPLISGSPFTLGFTIPPTFNIGFATYDAYSTFFQGDIAEIVGYNFPLSDSDKNQVYNYLHDKYFGSSSGVIPPPPFVLPTDISGLFGWYRSTSIGITGVDGSAVQYWKDESGSGNHLNIPIGSSGYWTPPTFYKNQFRVYPSVRFNNVGSTSYLSASGNQSFNFSSGDFTGFAVFKTNDITDSQCLYSIDSVGGIVSPCLSVELNDSGTNSFAFAGSSGVRTGFSSYDYVYARNTELGTNLYSAGTTVIRHDRFRKSDGLFVFGLYGSDIASGISHTNFNITNSLQVGYSLVDDNPLLGDLAEIILYRRKLSDGEVGLINTYLTQKYLPGNANIASLFTYSAINTGIYNNTSLYMLAAQSSVYTGIPLYVTSTSISNSGFSMYEISTGCISGNPILYTAGSFQQYPPITLFIGSENLSTSNISLYTQLNSQNLSITTLYMNGTNLSVTNNIPMYTAGSYQQYPPMQLFLASNYPFNNNLKLFLQSTIPTGSAHLGLHISGTTNLSLSKHTSLFLANVNSPGSNASGLYADKPLYLEAGRLYQNLPLYITTDIPPLNNNPTGHLNLFIGDPYVSGYWQGYTPLFVCNDVSGANSITKRLYINGLGQLVGGQSLPSYSLDLFLCNNQFNPITSSGNAGFFSENYLFNQYFQSDYFDIKAPFGSVVTQGNGGISLYMGSTVDDPNEIPLYISSFQQNNLIGGYFSPNYMAVAYFQPDYFDLLSQEGINSRSAGISLFISGSGTASQIYSSTIYTRGY